MTQPPDTGDSDTLFLLSLVSNSHQVRKRFVIENWGEEEEPSASVMLPPPTHPNVQSGKEDCATEGKSGRGALPFLPVSSGSVETKRAKR